VSNIESEKKVSLKEGESEKVRARVRVSRVWVGLGLV
jgi:predicted DNA-binding antitoxin AbrB/MazE fold protein